MWGARKNLEKKQVSNSPTSLKSFFFAPDDSQLIRSLPRLRKAYNRLAHTESVAANNNLLVPLAQKRRTEKKNILNHAPDAFRHIKAINLLHLRNRGESEAH